MKIKVFDTRNLNPMNNHISDLENITNQFLCNDIDIYNIDIKPYTHKDNTYYMAIIQYSEE